MGDSLKGQLAKIFPHLAPPPPTPAKHPPYSSLDIQQSFAKFCQELAGKSFKDPCGNEVFIFEENFPKFLNMKFIATGKNIKASIVIQALQLGTFDPSLYTLENDRLETLFWIPDVIGCCH